MIITATTDFIPGYNVSRVLGIAKGSTVRTKHIGTDMLASLKNIVGGELGGYTKMLTEARDEALKRMIEDAEKMGAHAVITVRLETAGVMQGAAEIVAYGTAVHLVNG